MSYVIVGLLSFIAGVLAAKWYNRRDGGGLAKYF